MRLRPDGSWLPFTAEQSISTRIPRFRWHARIRMAPLVTAVVEDSFLDGHGLLEAKLFGFIPLAHGEGLDIDRGELQRYLAEIVWAPHALLRNPEIRFSVLSSSSVRVWIQDEDTYVDLSFDGEGNIHRAYTETRSRDGKPQPWEGTFGPLKDFGTLLAPEYGEVSWLAPEGTFTYWRGRVGSIEAVAPDPNQDGGPGSKPSRRG